MFARSLKVLGSVLALGIGLALPASAIDIYIPGSSCEPQTSQDVVFVNGAYHVKSGFQGTAKLVCPVPLVTPNLPSLITVRSVSLSYSDPDLATAAPLPPPGSNSGEVKVELTQGGRVPTETHLLKLLFSSNSVSMNSQSYAWYNLVQAVTMDFGSNPSSPSFYSVLVSLVSSAPAKEPTNAFNLGFAGIVLKDYPAPVPPTPIPTPVPTAIGVPSRK